MGKQTLPINFSQGLDTKTDPKQVQAGRFLSLVNTIFDKGGLLQKRNGFGLLPSINSNLSNYLTTLNDNLTTVGSAISAFNTGTGRWVNKGSITPLKVSTLPLIRNNVNQNQCDSAISPNGLVCTVYNETNGSTTTVKYAIADSVSGQNIVAPVALPVSSGTPTGGARVFLLSNFFIIVFTNVITATSHLQYIAIATNNPTTPSAEVDLASAYVSSTRLAWDGCVANNSLYVAYNSTSGGQNVRVTYLTSVQAAGAFSGGGSPATAVVMSGYKATLMSLCADLTNSASPVIYVNFHDAVTNNIGFTAAFDRSLTLTMAPVRILNAAGVVNLASYAISGTCTVFSEWTNAYSYDAAVPSNLIKKISVTPLGTTFRSIFSAGAGTITASSATGLVNGMVLVDNTTPANITAGTTFTHVTTTLTLSAVTAGNSASSPGDLMTAATVSSLATVIRSVGLASKAFLIDDVAYFMAAYQSSYQPTYFLVNGSASVEASPVVVAKLAYGNGGGYLTTGLPSVSVDGSTAQMPYLFKDLVQSVNKNTAVPSGTQTAGIYSQTGINLGSFEFTTDGIFTSEIAKNLHISGGFLWQYDGYLPVEHNFLVWPDNVEATTATTGGSIADQQYYYRATYEWSDNQGNIYRSAPSIPITITTAGGNASTNTIKVPTLRLTYKTANPVKIVLYRWSTAQQTYYQVTSITVPTLNSMTADSVSITDTFSDATILGNNLLYTEGGIVEDVSGPATNLTTLFDDRLWLVDAEDPNLLWYSKQVIEATPVEMSDLFTVFIAPTTGTQGSTGPITALSAMDDKLIIFKANAMYYINGSGPDNTGANSQYSQPIFITGTVGCTNQKSIILTPQGLMFQSNKGIWLLGRDLSTRYLGDAVEEFNESVVESAVTVPETNQVRFTLDTGETLMFDYYYQQWGTFEGAPGLSSCIFESLHTFINEFGQIYQETPGLFLDGSSPVLIRFTTGWIQLAGINGFQRIYEFNLTAEYLSPHKLVVQVGYDFKAPSQQSIIQPDNFTGSYGGDSLYGQTSPYGGPGSSEKWRVQTQVQKCSVFQISLSEVYDPSFGVAAGAGFTLSGINSVLLIKKGYSPTTAANTVG